MATDFISQITRESLYLVIVASGLPIVLSLIVGFAVSIFQATTQIQEQTLTFAPKLVMVFGVLALAGPWIGGQLVRFTFECFNRFALVVR
jgi:flagellar biosynthesis protein FliQ